MLPELHRQRADDEIAVAQRGAVPKHEIGRPVVIPAGEIKAFRQFGIMPAGQHAAGSAKGLLRQHDDLSIAAEADPVADADAFGKGDLAGRADLGLGAEAFEAVLHFLGQHGKGAVLNAGAFFRLHGCRVARAQLPKGDTPVSAQRQPSGAHNLHIRGGPHLGERSADGAFQRAVVIHAPAVELGKQDPRGRGIFTGLVEPCHAIRAQLRKAPGQCLQAPVIPWLAGCAHGWH